jgi:hypothetical protein
VKRRLFNILAVLSLMMTIAIASVYFRTSQGDSFYIRDGNRQFYFLDFYPKSISFNWSPPNMGTEKGWTFGHRQYGTAYYELPVNSMWNRMGIWTGFTGALTMPNGDYVRFQQLILPLWLGSLVFAIPPFCWVCRFVYCRHRRKLNLCPVCGYDLRATPDRCPECGMAPKELKLS